MSNEPIEQRKELQNTEGFLIGKELAGTGKHEGKEWKRYKVKFKPSMDSEKAFSFTAFTPLTAKSTKQLDDLEEGKQYRICYTEQERDYEGKPYMSKTVIGFYSPTNGISNKVGHSNGKSGSAKIEKIDLGKFPAFKEEYMEAVKKNKMKSSAVHMLGSFIYSHEKERVEEVFKKCEEALK